MGGMAAPAIRTDGLTKRFPIPTPWRQRLRRPLARSQREVVAVDQVSLEVREGELFGLLGPNGAGKTTLIKLLCTLVEPTAGSAQVGGVDLRHTARVLAQVGMASGDERSFYWRLSGRHNLEFFAALYGLRPAAARRRVAELLEQFELTEQADRPFSTYSSGQKQRLSIARALLHRPRVLFLDEPTRSLDPTAASHLHRFIQEELQGREGITILLTTHRLEEAQRLCHRIGIMHRGRLRACGTVPELRSALAYPTIYVLRVSGLAALPGWPALGQGTRIAATPLPGDGAWQVRLETNDGETALPELLSSLVRAGARVHAMEQEQASLEHIFQRLTAEEPAKV